MTKTKLLLASLLIVLGLGVSVPSALAQITFGVTTTIYTLRPEGNAEAVGPIIFTTSAGGTVETGQVFNLTFSQPIIGASGIAAVYATTPADFCSSVYTGVATACNAATPDISITAASSTVTVTFGVTTVFSAGDSFTVYGIRVKAYGLAGGTYVTALASAPTIAGHPVIFGNGTNAISVYAGLVGPTPALTQSNPTSTGSVLTCYSVPNAADSSAGSTPAYSGAPVGFLTTVTENWAGAWTSKTDETTLAPYLVTNGSIIAITVSGIPLGLKVTPLTPANNPLAGTQTWGPTPAAYTGVVKNDSTTFLYTLATTSMTTIEGGDFAFTLSSSAPLQPANPPMYVSVQMYPPPSTTSPVYPSFSYPVFGYAYEPPGTPTIAFTFLDCVTNLLFPYVTNTQIGGSAVGYWDTALLISNATSDKFSTGVPTHASPQTGPCTFYIYSAGTGGSVGSPVEATPYTFTTPVTINSGGSYGFMLSSTSAATITAGYAIATCSFLDGYGYAAIMDNSVNAVGGDYHVMGNYLAKVYNTNLSAWF